MLLSVEDELVVVKIAKVAASNARVRPGAAESEFNVHRIHDERVCVAVGGDFVAGVPKKRHTVEVFYPDLADVVLKLGKLERVV